MKPSPSTFIASAIVAALTSVLVVLLFFGGVRGDTSGNRSETRYAKITSSGSIRAAYAVGAPLFIVDPNTRQKSGIFHDLVTEAASRLGLRVEWNEEVGYGEMIQGLRANRYDIVGSGVWINADRAKGADFSIPAYYDVVYAYVRANDTRFSNGLTSLDSPQFTISTMDGELGAAIARSDFPRARRLELPQNADFSQMIANVVAQRADIVFLAAGAAAEYQTANPGRIARASNQPVRVFPDAIMLPQGDSELRQALNYALLEMLSDGTVERILRRYEQAPGTFLRVAEPYRQPAAAQ